MMNSEPIEHDASSFLDRQIQNKLLDVDEQLWSTDYTVESKGYTDVKVTKTIKVSKKEDIMGWFCNSKTVLRKPEKDKPVQQPVSYSWREQNRLKNLIQGSFVFKHYPISKSYIEQYREENSQLSGIKSPTNNKESSEPKKVGLQHNSAPPATQVTPNSGSVYSSPSACNVCSQCSQPSSSPSQNLITAAFNYTRRETTSLGSGACKCNHNQSTQTPACSKHKHYSHSELANQAYKYKLSKEAVMHHLAWRSDSEQSSENDAMVKENKTPRVLSGKRSAGKTPTKVTVPSLPTSKNVQSVTVQQINSQGKLDGASVTTQQNLRALDALTCIAAEKQRRTRPYSTVQVRALGHILMDSIKGVAIKRPDSSLMYATMDFSRSKSELPEKPESRNGNYLDSPELLLLNGESDNLQHEVRVVNSDEDSDIISLSRFSTMCLGADIKAKENNNDLEPPCAVQVFPNNNLMMKNAMRVVNGTSRIWQSSNTYTAPQVKKEFTFHTPTPSLKTPDIKLNMKPASNSTNQLKRCQSDSKLDFPAIPIDSKSSLVVPGINLTQQARLDTPDKFKISDATKQITRGSVMKTLKHKYAGYVRSKKIHKSQSDLHSSFPKPSAPNAEKKSSPAKPYPESAIPDKIKVLPIYSLWSTDGNKSNSNVTEAQSARSSKQLMVNEQSLQRVAAFILSEHKASTPPDGRLKQEIAVADGIVPENPNLEGLTWIERMEMLRSIRKKNEIAKHQKQVKLTFVKDTPVEDKHQRLTGMKAPPDNLTSLAAQGQTKSQLFEQRRIKHLLQQARLKRNSNFDWLTESPRFRYSHDDDSDSSSYSDTEVERSKSPKCFSPGMDIGHAESTLLSRYNIKPFVKGGGWKVTPMTMQRARTIVYDD